MFKILSWNVNGIRAAETKGLFEFLQRESPDVLCLQETKAQPVQLERKFLEQPGYQVYWSSAEKRGYSGTACYVKRAPLSVQTMGRPEFDSEGRVLTLEYDDFFIVNAYWPNSREERARLPYKLDFCREIGEYCTGLVARGKHVVSCGDYNIAHEPIDLARPRQNENSAGYYIEEREAMTRYLGLGFVDVFRHANKEPGHYTWWSYRGGARAGNVGWRIDYHCVDAGFLPRVKRATIMPEVLGSDHCPVGLEVE